MPGMRSLTVRVDSLLILPVCLSLTMRPMDMIWAPERRRATILARRYACRRCKTACHTTLAIITSGLKVGSHNVKFSQEEPPSRMLLRSGAYDVHSRVQDDDGNVYAGAFYVIPSLFHLIFIEWAFKLGKE
jgi:hypothetical protein